MNRYLVCMMYDGTGFLGWQKQVSGRTVQNVFENALAEIAKQPVKTIGSSRTDTGVHALCHYSHFDFPVNLSPIQLQLALTNKLPKDIKVIEIHIVSRDFHSRYKAIGRAYRFEITKEINPFNRNYKTYFPKYPIDAENISKCVPMFLGMNNFELFAQKNESLKHYMSDIKEVAFTEQQDGYVFCIAADRFYHNMVRRIIGTLVKLSKHPDLQQIISGLLNGNKAYHHMVYTAPPQGLYLTKISYPDEFRFS